jgi:hypothetical protein
MLPKLMARESRALGKYELPPKLSMSEAARIAAKIVGQFRDSNFSEDALASALGHANSTGGAYNQKVADLRKYGVIVGRAPSLAAGPIAQAIYADRPGEKERALHEMLAGIPLFKALYDQYGEKLPDDGDLTTYLLHFTGAGRPDIEGTLASLREAYRDACSTIPAMPGGTKSTSPTSQFRHGLATDHVRHPAATNDRFTSTTSEYEFWVTDDAGAIADLIDLLDTHKKALDRKHKAGTKSRGSETSPRPPKA